MTERPLSVEIFRDADRKHVSTEPAEAGVEMLRNIATGLAIVRTTRLIRISQEAGNESIEFSKIRFPALVADINLIVTDRELLDAELDSKETAIPTSSGIRFTTRNVGLASYAQGIHALRVGIITTDTLFPHYAAAHEMGHLLGLKRNGGAYDGEAHCADETCLMQPTNAYTQAYEDIATQSLLDKVFGRKPTIERVWGEKKIKGESLCSECAGQLGQNAFYLQKAKAGEHIPSVLIP